jgi:hypothetical protein
VAEFADAVELILRASPCQQSPSPVNVPSK